MSSDGAYFERRKKGERIRSTKNVLSSLGSLIRGDVVLVPVSTYSYENRVKPRLGADTNDGDVIEEALWRAPLEFGEVIDMAKHYGLPLDRVEGRHHQLWHAPLPEDSQELTSS